MCIFLARFRPAANFAAGNPLAGFGQWIAKANIGSWHLSPRRTARVRRPVLATTAAVVLRVRVRARRAELLINPNPLVLNTQPNSGTSATVNLTSSGAAISFLAATIPNTSWLHMSPSGQQTTPSTLTVSTDSLPSGFYTTTR